MRRGSIVAALLLLLTTAARGGEGESPLPEPLGLADAIRMARPVPVLLRADSARQEAQARALSARALGGSRLTLAGRLWAIEPSSRSKDDDRNDSGLHLSLRKRLYDSGYSDALLLAAGGETAASEAAALEARQQQVLAIMRAFFDVILADLENARDNEAMSVAFVAADRARDRNEVGQVSDVERLRAEADYQEALSRQRLSAQRQRLARSALAIAMGRPGQLVSELEPPAIEPVARDEEDFETFWERVEHGHPRLRQLGARLEGAMAALAAARNSESAVLSAGLDAALYNRASSTTHPVGGGLLFEVPLSSGGRKAAAVRQAEADVTAARARLLEARLRLRQEALEAWLDDGRLLEELEALWVGEDYRDLYLDRSRALYELEVKTDLGDAMTQISELHLKRARLLFAWAMNRARMRAMTGELP